METNNRETRRRRIVDRGSDRLALITGRIQTLPSSSSPELDPDSSQPLDSHHQDPQPLLSDQATVSPNGKDEAFGSMLLKHDPITDAAHTNSYDGGSSVESPLRKCETSIEALKAPALEVSGKVQSSLVSSTDRNSSISTSGTEQHLEPQTRRHRFFTPNEISSAITASATTRLYCSVTVALFVVLSYLGFPILGSYIIKSIINFSPLYLVLLTNITLVLARLLFDHQGGFKRSIREENNNPSSEGYVWAGQVSKALEVGLLMQKAIDAVFMDCSVYAVIVICGLSLA